MCIRDSRVTDRFHVQKLAYEAVQDMRVKARWEALDEESPFDPNRTDSVTFCRLGLPAWMAKNILRYRSKGGKFRKAEDFKKV